MQRTRGKVIGVVAACAAAGLLAACGNNDSTATSTPTLSATTKASAPATTSASGSSGQPSTSESSAPESSAAERPEPVPTEFITPPADTPALSDKDKTFLEELKKRGVVPSSPDIALTAGNLVCQGKAENAPEDQIITYVTAIAGADPSFDASKMPVEQAGKIYYEVASASYCK